MRLETSRLATEVTLACQHVQGPPGTGKTRTLLAFIEIMVKTPSKIFPFAPILACADTNAAVDNIVEGLVQRGVKVVRLGQPAKVHTSSCSCWLTRCESLTLSLYHLLCHSGSLSLSLSHSLLSCRDSLSHSFCPLPLAHALTHSKHAVINQQQSSVRVGTRH